jgi:GxxExxY protein
MEFEEITEKFIGCAYTVYNKMGFGFLESVYEKCLIIELESKGMNVKAQQQIIVRYKDKEVGNFIPIYALANL